KAYKEYYACATGEAAPKPNASARKKKGDSTSFTTPPTLTPTTTVVSAPRLSATAKGDKTDESDDGSNDGNDDDDDEAVKAGFESDKDDDYNDDEEEPVKNDDEDTESGSEDESNDEEDQELRLSDEARIQEEEEADELYCDVNINQGRGIQVTQNIEESHVTLTPVHPDGPQESLSVSSFVTSMLNPINDAGVESIFTTASSPIVSLQKPTPIMTPSTIATTTTSRYAPIPSTTIPSIILENLPMFNSAFRFDERLRGTYADYLSDEGTPHIRCLKQVLTINQLFKHLSILNGFPSQGDHLHRIVTGTKLCQLLKEMLNHGLAN
nr:hypothetical protein [Tanacetum cinerariifolium]